MSDEQRLLISADSHVMEAPDFWLTHLPKHTHTEEDHVFVVLSGQATFHLDQEENVFVVNQFEGAFLPAGAFYWFENTGQGNLVMVRCGAIKPGVEDRRIGPDGRPIPSGTLENKSYPRIEMSGKFFPEDCSQPLPLGIS